MTKTIIALIISVLFFAVSFYVGELIHDSREPFILSWVVGSLLLAVLTMIYGAIFALILMGIDIIEDKFFSGN